MRSKSMLETGIRLVWFDVRPGVQIATFRGSKYEILAAPTDYCAEIEHRQSDALASPTGIKSAVEAATYALLDLYRFLHKERKRLIELDNREVLQFRNWVFLRVRGKARSRGDKSALRSVNVKLRIVYQFLHWCQQNAYLRAGSMGSGKCSITSTLPEICGSSNEHERSDTMKYPALFRRTGEYTRIGKPQHWATGKEIEIVEREFHDNRNPAVARRDTLILRIVEQMAWRRESVVTLTTDLFDDNLFQQAEDIQAAGFDITPATQKFGYSVGFSMPWALAYSIKRYIQNDRSEIIKRCGIRDSKTKGHIFLSTRTGLPLHSRSVSNAFGKAFKLAGAPTGTAVHAVRRYSGNLKAREEIDFRVRHGLSTAREDVTEALAAKLGQSSTSSISFYVKATADMKRDSISDVHAESLASAYAIIAELRTRISELKRLGK